MLQPVVFLKKADGILLFLKAFSWVTLGDFTVKTAKLEMEIRV